MICWEREKVLAPSLGSCPPLFTPPGHGTGRLRFPTCSPCQRGAVLLHGCRGRPQSRSSHRLSHTGRTATLVHQLRWLSQMSAWILPCFGPFWTPFCNWSQTENYFRVEDGKTFETTPVYNKPSQTPVYLAGSWSSPDLFLFRGKGFQCPFINGSRHY